MGKCRNSSSLEVGILAVPLLLEPVPFWSHFEIKGCFSSFNIVEIEMH